MRGLRVAVVALVALLATALFLLYRTHDRLAQVCDYAGRQAERETRFARMLDSDARAAVMMDLAQAEREMARQTGQQVDLRRAKATAALEICRTLPGWKEPQ